MSDAALAGRTVIVTRGGEPGRAWADALRALGADVLLRPCLRVEHLPEDVAGPPLLAALEGARWLALTSINGVEAASGLLGGALPEGVRVAAVAPATAAACASRLVPASLVAPEGTGRSLAEALLDLLPPASGDGRPRIVVAAAEEGRRDLERIIPRSRADIVRVAVYRTVPHPPLDPPEDLRRLDRPVVLLASPSAVTGLLNRARLPESARAVTIGPSTSEAARSAGLRVAGQARERTLESMLEVIR